MKRFECIIGCVVLLVATSLFPLHSATPRNYLAPPEEEEDARSYVISSTGQFGVVNLETGDFKLIGMTPKVLSGIGRGKHGILYGLDSDNNLVTINPNTAATLVVGNIGLPVLLDGNTTLFTSIGTSRLFGIDPSNTLYSIDPQTGHANLIAPTGIPAPDFDTCGCVTANSLVGAEGSLYFTWEIDDLATGKPKVPSTLYRINPSTGIAHLVGLTQSPAAIVGSGFVEDTLFAFTFGMPVNQPNKILTLDLESGKASFVSNQAANLDAVFGATRLNKRHRD